LRLGAGFAFTLEGEVLKGKFFGFDLLALDRIGNQGKKTGICLESLGKKTGLLLDLG